MKNLENLIPTTGQKSFYGKAKIIFSASGILLKSYDTIVCMIADNGEFKRLWNDWSATTMKHVNAFREKYGMDKLNKADWLKLNV